MKNPYRTAKENEKENEKKIATVNYKTSPKSRRNQEQIVGTPEKQSTTVTKRSSKANFLKSRNKAPVLYREKLYEVFL